jgi:hypothetical protein
MAGEVHCNVIILVGAIGMRTWLAWDVQVWAEKEEKAYFLNRSSKACRASFVRGAGAAAAICDCWA